MGWSDGWPALDAGDNQCRKGQGIPLSPGAKYLASYKFERTTVAETSNNLLEAWGIASLYLDQHVDAAVKRLWIFRAEVLVALDQFAMNLDAHGTPPYPDAWRTLYDQPAQTRLKELMQELRALIEPIAKHEP